MEAKRIKEGNNFIILIILLLALALVVIKFLHDSELPYPYSLSNFVDRGDYKIEPHTILADLENGKKNVFKPVGNDPIENNKTSFSWQQSDYLIVADSLHQFVWNETLDGWDVFGMILARECRDDLVGFDAADITFYKSNNQGGYRVHEMQIYPSGNGVSWGSDDNWPSPLFGWTSINLQRLRVTAENALQIAEKNGGNEFRAKAKNMCDIHLIIKPNPDGDNDWIVFYSANDGSDHFEVQIDPYTGWH